MLTRTTKRKKIVKKAPLKKPQKIDWAKYSKIKFPDDVLTYLKELRNEWR
jgi:hypothetical protein